MGAKPYQIGLPKCRNFGMSDSAKYPGLCKQHYIKDDVGKKSESSEFNSINAQRKNPASHYTYKTYNSEYDNKRIVSSSSSTSNSVPFYTNQHPRLQQPPTNYNNVRIANNELHSFVKRQQQSPYQQQQQQQQQQRQYDSNQARTIVVTEKLQSNVQQQQQQLTPFLQAYHQHIQQSTERRSVDKNNPFQTYRWDQLFKNYV